MSTMNCSSGFWLEIGEVVANGALDLSSACGGGAIGPKFLDAIEGIGFVAFLSGRVDIAPRAGPDGDKRGFVWQFEQTPFEGGISAASVREAIIEQRLEPGFENLSGSSEGVRNMFAALAGMLGR